MSLMTEKLPMMHKIIGLVKEAMEKTKKCPPMVICFKGEKIIHLSGLCTDETKHAFYRAVGALCKKEGCDFIMIINDAAIKAFKNPEDYKNMIDNYETESPLTYPKSMRTDCIILIGYAFATEESKIVVQPYKEENGGYTWQELVDTPEFDGAIIRGVKEGFNIEL